MKKRVLIGCLGLVCGWASAAVVGFSAEEGYSGGALRNHAYWSGSSGFVTDPSNGGSVGWTNNYIQMNYIFGIAETNPVIEISVQFRMSQANGYSSGLKPVIGIQLEKDASGDGLIADGLNDVRAYFQRTSATTFNLVFNNTTEGGSDQTLLPGFSESLLGLSGMAGDESDLLELKLVLRRGITEADWTADAVLKNVTSNVVVSQVLNRPFASPEDYFTSPLYAAFNGGLQDGDLGVDKRTVEVFSSTARPIEKGGFMVVVTADYDRPASTFSPFEFGSITPSGWLGHMLNNDTTNGTFSCFHNSWMVQNKAFALRGDNPDKTDDYPHLWDGAAEGYWGYALLMGSVFSEDPVVKQRAEDFLTDILNSQDADGYIGIYPPETRYTPATVDQDVHKGFLFLGMLYYAQANDRPDVIDAVERAVQCDMANFNRFTPELHAQQFMVMSYPFMLDMLASFTSNSDYADYAAFLYEDFSLETLNTPWYFADCKLNNLLDPTRLLIGHACNTTGNMAMPYIAYYATGNPLYLQAGDEAFLKFQRQASVSGSLPGDEDNRGRLSFPDIPIEYCTTTYLVENALLAAEKTGIGRYVDLAEKCLYNAGLGARMPDGSTHAYLKCDNEKNLDDDTRIDRFHYSPAHEPFCCTTRMMSLLPFFAGQLFKQSGDTGVVAVCYAPSTLQCTVNGVGLEIEELTNYPFDHRVEFVINPASSVAFDLTLRIPGWATNAVLTVPLHATVAEDGEWRHISGQWAAGDHVVLDLEAGVVRKESANREYYLMYGPLVFGLPITPVDVSYDLFPSGHSASNYSNGRFSIHRFQPGNDLGRWDCMFDGDVDGTTFGFDVVDSGQVPQNPWEDPPLTLSGPVFLKRTSAPATMVPMGSTILRRVTLPIGHGYHNGVYPDDLGQFDDNTSL